MTANQANPHSIVSTGAYEPASSVPATHECSPHLSASEIEAAMKMFIWPPGGLLDVSNLIAPGEVPTSPTSTDSGSSFARKMPSKADRARKRLIEEKSRILRHDGTRSLHGSVRKLPEDYRESLISAVPQNINKGGKGGKISQAVLSYAASMALEDLNYVMKSHPGLKENLMERRKQAINANGGVLPVINEGDEEASAVDDTSSIASSMEMQAAPTSSKVANSSLPFPPVNAQQAYFYPHRG